MATSVTPSGSAPPGSAGRSPPRAAPRRPRPAAPQGPPPPRRRPDDRGALGGGLALSALLHLLAVFLYSLLGERSPAAFPAGAAPAPTAPEGIEVVRLLELADELEAPSAPVTERAAPVPARPTVPGPPSPAAPEGVAPPPPGRGLPPVAERLRPGEADERLWRIDPDLTELSDRELARLLLIWTIEEMGDSTLAEEARARAGTDWTYTDDQGRKWGISQGRLHLGDLTLPLPFYFSSPPGSEAARRAWEDREIARAAGAAAARANMQDRIRAIRERRDQERENRRTTPPDTVRRPGG